MTNGKFQNGCATRLNSFFRVAFVVLIAAFFSYAQTTEEKTSEKTFTTPKVTQIDETKIAAILKPNGKPLLVNFWATWCVPCREEFPDLVEIDEEFKGKIDFITVTLDDPAEKERDVPKFLTEMKAAMPTFLLYTNQESEVISSVSKDWQGGLPFTILYDANGTVIYTKQGKIAPETVKTKLKSLVEKPAVIEDKTLQTLELPINSGEKFSYEKGVADAKKDVAAGRFVIKHYGLVPMSSPEHTEKLRRDYGIETLYFGCLVSPEMVEYGKGYNEISVAAIKSKFGAEILER